MKIYKLIYLAFFAFLLSGCIGPWYNPYPISKLVARVGPPLKIGSEIPKELLSTEISSKSDSESETELLSSQAEIENTEPEIDLGPIVNIEKVDNKTIIISWSLNMDENLILPPKQVVDMVKDQCDNNSLGHLLSFSSVNGIASATFKCW